VSEASAQNARLVRFVRERDDRASESALPPHAIYPRRVGFEDRAGRRQRSWAIALALTLHVVLFAKDAAADPNDAKDAPLLGDPPSPPASSPPVSPSSFAPMREDDERDAPKPLLALLAGSITATASATAGVVLISRYPNDRDLRNAALLGMQTGLTLAPLFAHMVVHETRRGLFFALIPFASEVAMATTMAFVPNLITIASVPVQYTYIGLLTTSVFGAALGTLDAVRVSERAPKKTAASPAIHFTPMIGGASSGAAYGAMLGGTL